MRTLAVIEAHVRPECGGSVGGARVWCAVRPLAQQGLNEALRLAVRLRMVGPGEAMSNGPRPTRLGEDARTLGKAVVGKQPADTEPAAAIPAHGAT
jgi:hypothetical protein